MRPPDNGALRGRGVRAAGDCMGEVIGGGEPISGLKWLVN